MAALGLVFMGAIVLPVYLVPALTLVLVVGLSAESHLRCVTAVRTSVGSWVSVLRRSAMPGG
jgi:hypothetical protein